MSSSPAPSAPQYHCEDLGRRRAVLAQPAPDPGDPDPRYNGLDYLEIATVDQRELDVFFLLPTRLSLLGPANFIIEGGERVTGIRVTAPFISVSVSARRIRLRVSARGDFSTYLLRVVTSPTDSAPPPGFDPRLCALAFSFKVACPSDFDCRQEEVCPPEVHPEPELDYLAKDYGSFRRLMLDRLSVLLPEWRDRHPADLQVTLVELLAQAGDHLSYFQDAAATEAYLGTARLRGSVRRHARLLDYALGEGCNARAFVHLRAAAAATGRVLPAGPGAAFCTRLPDIPVLAGELPTGPAAAQVSIFEPLHALTLRASHNEIAFHTWSDALCCLPRGATRATLVNPLDPGDPDAGLDLQPGDLLLLEETHSPVTGLAADADRSRRHVVRLETVLLGPAVMDPIESKPGVPVYLAEVTWRSEDALPFALRLSARVGDSSASLPTAVARGNIVLADHGRSLAGSPLEPAAVPLAGAHRPTLLVPGLAFAAPFPARVLVPDPLDPSITTVLPASQAFEYSPADALPCLVLRDGSDEVWSPRRDLLASDRFAPEFVVEVGNDRTSRLRFGDDLQGRRPSPGTVFVATARHGGGSAGNLGAEALRHVIAPSSVLPAGSVLEVRNPLPARGGADPESLEQARQFAPGAFRRQERAVTERDWAEVAQRFPGVQRAAARFRWTGSWHTVFVAVDRVGGLGAVRDPRFQAALRDHLERYRIAGYDLEIVDPIFVPLEIKLLVCVRPGYFRAKVHAALRAALGRFDPRTGRPGFFHPDNFSFGQPLHLAPLVAACLAVPGAGSVQPLLFQRQGRLANHELENGLLTAAPLEILRLDDDANFPERGRLTLDLHGGL
jgi:hypothetical protein